MSKIQCGIHLRSIIQEILAFKIEECEICDVFIPNVFSPNHDGTNDIFKPYSDCELFDFKLKIFNRWGAVLFESSAPWEGWDGTNNGNCNNMGVYTWIMAFSVVENNKFRRVQLNGDITLLR